MSAESVRIERPEGVNIVLGQTHFIKSAEDLYEAMVNSVPGIKFGLAFCEASGPCKVRVEGNDEELKALAGKNAMRIGAGHSFIVLMKDAYPINVLKAIKEVPEVCGIFCATANDVDVILETNAWGRGILGVIDGERSKGVETPEEAKERKAFLRRIGYKL